MSRLPVALIFALILVGLMLFVSAQPGPAISQQPPTTPAESLPQARGGIARAVSFDTLFRQTGIDSWHAAGWTGTGVRIGVLDRGFAGLMAFEQTVNIEVHVGAGVDKTIWDQGIVSHGTNVLDVIHQCAPSAELYAYRYDTLEDFRLGVTQFIASDVDIIVHSAGVPSLPLDGTNDWAREVDRAARADVLWINAAGNFNGGYLDEIFTDIDGDSYHEFRGRGGDPNLLHVNPVLTGQYGVVALSWYDNPDAPNVNLDLYILDDQGKLLAASTNEQNDLTGQRAEERAGFVMDSPFNVQVRDLSGNATDTEFILFIEFADLAGGNRPGSIIAPGDSLNALTVGALAQSKVASFSSRGLRDAPFVKPDLVTVGGIELTDGAFIGTSASAPIVAGAAALVSEANRYMDRSTLYAFMREHAAQDDTWQPGIDTDYGFGFLYLPPPSITPTPAPKHTDIAITLTSEPTLLYEVTPAAAPSSSLASVVVTVNTASANLRTGPGIGYDILGSANAGEEFAVIAEGEDVNGIEWYLIQWLDDERAWIASWLVTVEPVEAEVQAAATIPPLPTQRHMSNESSTNCQSSRLIVGQRAVVTESSDIIFVNGNDPEIVGCESPNAQGTPVFYWCFTASEGTVVLLTDRYIEDEDPCRWWIVEVVGRDIRGFMEEYPSLGSSEFPERYYLVPE